MKKILIISLILTAFLSSIELYSQLPSDTLSPSDTVIFKSKAVMTKSPSGAIWRSLALPGWGQIYVETYWKAPIFFAAAGTLAYLIIDNHSKYSDYEDRLSKMSKEDPDYKNIKLYRELHRDNRDMSGFFLLGVYILAAVDAYSGAHLYDFEVNSNISLQMNIRPYPFPAAGFFLKF